MLSSLQLVFFRTPQSLEAEMEINKYNDEKHQFLWGQQYGNVQNHSYFSDHLPGLLSKRFRRAINFLL